MSDNKKKSKKTTKRTKRIPGVGNGAPARIFGGGNDIIPGEVIVQLSDAASASITSAIPRGPSRGFAISATQSFGHSDLDAALKGIKVKSITRLHPPAPRASFAMAAALELATTFRVAFDDKTAVSCPSVTTICGPSLTTRCPPSQLICPSGPICGGPDLPDPGPVLAQQPQWGEQAQDLEDPYAQQYPEE